MVKELDREDIIKKLNTDFAFLVRFILDNNLNAVVQNLKVAGVKVPLTYTKKDILDIVYTEIARGNVDEMLKALNVPYLASADNYTDGFEDYFNPTTKTETETESGESASAEESKGSFWAMLGATIVNALPNIIDAFGGDSTTPPPPPPPARKNTGLIVGGVLVVIAIVVIILVRRKKKA